MGKWTKIMLVFIFMAGSIIGFMVKLPSGLRHIDKELHALFYFVAAAFLNIMFANKKMGRHMLIFTCLALFGVAIEYAQEYSNTFFHTTIHGRYDIEDVKANLKGLVAFSILWMIYFVATLFTKKKAANSPVYKEDALANEAKQPAIFSGMEIFTRPATENDIEILLEFEQGIVTAERPYDPTLKEGKIHYYDLMELIRSADAEVVVAVAGGQLIGSGYAKIRVASDYLKHDRFAYLGFMYTRPDFRGKGINKMILEALINWAKLKGITEIRLDVYNENTAAINAYLKAGFTPNLLEMRRSI